MISQNQRRRKTNGVSRNNEDCFNVLPDDYLLRMDSLLFLDKYNLRFNGRRKYMINVRRSKRIWKRKVKK